MIEQAKALEDSAAQLTGIDRRRAEAVAAFQTAMAAVELDHLRWQRQRRGLGEAVAWETVHEGIKGTCKAVAANVKDAVMHAAFDEGLL